MELLVDFTAVHLNNIKHDISKPTYSKDYDDMTTTYYKSHRIQNSDPITYEELKEGTCFSYYNMWNPYTGNILENDPFGPLCFNPVSIITHLYCSRLNNLWINESDEKNGLYSGYYGDGVGAGKDFEIINKGKYPERYIFRLPIANCYLSKNHDMNTITVGPELSNQDIHNLDCLMTTYYKDDEIYRKIGSLKKLKRYYDIAISKNPTSLDFNGDGINMNSVINHDNTHNYLNRVAVNIIRLM